MWHDIRLLNASSNTLLGVVALALLAAGAWWVAQRPVFTLREIRIEGAPVELRHINVSTVRSTAIPRIKGNFFTANLDEARSAFEMVPWVHKAAVRREWPNKLIVTLEEHVPLGTWGEDGRLISVKGDLFTVNLAEADEDGDLPAFLGPAGSEKEIVARFKDLQQWFAPVKLVPKSVSLSSRYAWMVKTSNGIALELGREQSKTTLKDRVERFVRIYPQLAARLQDRIESVDMRYPNGLALRASGMSFGPEIGHKAPKKK